jgi:hypothetical protein
MTREQLIARVGNAFDAGLLTPERIRLMSNWLDFVLRFEGGQMNYVVDFLESERMRTGLHQTLANDVDGYALIQFAAILTHPCQQCAVDPGAWWTRPGLMCRHRDGASA